ncbi:MAG TPA: hypothetical protein VGX23_27870 [Actinocrinis sp.]|nr:hypothetical protein [Actinocrinis sp.]
MPYPSTAWPAPAAARAVALDRCEVDPKDTPCSGGRVLSLVVWTGDGLSETWDRLCVRRTVDYADQWDPAYAELVVGGRGGEICRALAELHSARPGDLNIRMPKPGEDDYGRLLPQKAEGNEPVWASPKS